MQQEAKRDIYWSIPIDGEIRGTTNATPSELGPLLARLINLLLNSVEFLKELPKVGHKISARIQGGVTFFFGVANDNLWDDQFGRARHRKRNAKILQTGATPSRPWLQHRKMRKTARRRGHGGDDTPRCIKTKSQDQVRKGNP